MRSALGEAMTAVFEREGVLARMALTLQRARDGQGGSLFIIGEAGLGKTTLLERAQAMADGFEVGYGRGQAIESGLPFGLVSEALGRLGGPNPLEAFADGQPFNAPDADTLNALLMSEIPRDSVATLAPGDEAFGGAVTILDASTLRCSFS